jgi:tetratricopeptide (TPR) repeat protein
MPNSKRQPPKKLQIPSVTYAPWLVIRHLSLALLFLLALPRFAFGHGALLIRIAEVTKEIELATNNVAELYFERAELRRADQTWAEAETDYLKAEECSGPMDLPGSGTSPARARPSLVPLSTIRAAHANMLAEAGRHSDALSIFDEVISKWPSTATAYIGRARVHSALNQAALAVADYRKGINLVQNNNPQNVGLSASADEQPEWYLEVAKLLGASGEPDQALTALDQGIRRFGPLVMLQLFAIDLELGAHRTGPALARLDTILQRAPRKETWLAKRGDILLGDDRYSEAREAYENSLRAVRLLPSRLQQNPPMQKLIQKLNSALQTIAERQAAKDLPVAAN